MKLLSIAPIAIATIVGSAIAAHVALHARDSEVEVNPFECDFANVYSRESAVAVLNREVDGEPADDLFTRQTPQHDHAVAAHACLQAGHACLDAGKESLMASYNQLSSGERHHWRRTAHNHAQVAVRFFNKYYAHDHASRSPTMNEALHATVHVDTHAAQLWKAHAEQCTREANVAANHPQ